MKYEPPMWAEARANRNIYVTEDLARAAELEALRVHERERAAMICHACRDLPADEIAERILGRKP
jgi:DNA-directed RNA polymerase specialized sigma24 family protein